VQTPDNMSDQRMSEADGLQIEPVSLGPPVIEVVTHAARQSDREDVSPADPNRPSPPARASMPVRPSPSPSPSISPLPSPSLRWKNGSAQDGRPAGSRLPSNYTAAIRRMSVQAQSTRYNLPDFELDQPTGWRMWKSPLLMVGFLIIGLAMSIGHIVYNVLLDGTLVGDQSSQETNFR
jgi:hypothetical protein